MRSGYWVTWQSDNTPVATINGNGLATTHIEGTANIWVTYNGLTSNPIPLTVTAPELTKITISPASTSIAALNVAKFTAQAVFSNNSTRDMTYQVNWSSTNTIVTSLREYLNIYPFLSNGYTSYQYDLDNTFIGLQSGTTTITAASGAISGTAEITVESNSYHIRQNKHVPTTSMPDWVNQPFGREWFTYTTYDANGNSTGTVTIDLGARIILPYSIGQKGCHMVCAAMVVTKSTGQTLNPKLFNDWLNNPAHMGYTPGNGIDWDILNNNYNIFSTKEINMEKAPVKNKKGVVTDPGYTVADSYIKIDAALNNGKMVILRINGKNGHFQGHYVLIISGNNGNYKIYDPWIRNGDKDTQVDDVWNMYQIPGDYKANYNIITIK